jgi:hypothetical protein
MIHNKNPSIKYIRYFNSNTNAKQCQDKKEKVLSSERKSRAKKANKTGYIFHFTQQSQSGALFLIKNDKKSFKNP